MEWIQGMHPAGAYRAQRYFDTAVQLRRLAADACSSETRHELAVLAMMYEKLGRRTGTSRLNAVRAPDSFRSQPDIGDPIGSCTDRREQGRGEPKSIPSQ